MALPHWTCNSWIARYEQQPGKEYIHLATYERTSQPRPLPHLFSFFLSTVQRNEKFSSQQDSNLDCRGMPPPKPMVSNLHYTKQNAKHSRLNISKLTSGHSVNKVLCLSNFGSRFCGATLWTSKGHTDGSDGHLELKLQFSSARQLLLRLERATPAPSLHRLWPNGSLSIVRWHN